MSTSSFLYAILRGVRLAEAVRKGRTDAYLRRSFKAWLVAKLTAGWRR